MARGERISGDKIRTFREERNLLQHDLASRLRERGFGTTQVTISRWENGQSPRTHVLSALADELGCTVDALYEDASIEEAAQQGERFRNAGSDVRRAARKGGGEAGGSGSGGGSDVKDAA